MKGDYQDSVVVIKFNVLYWIFGIQEIDSIHSSGFDKVSPNFVFHQDNARVHTARVVMDHLVQGITVLMKWPACSLDLIAIELLWSQLKIAVYGWMQENTTLTQLSQIAK